MKTKILKLTLFTCFFALASMKSYAFDLNLVWFNNSICAALTVTVYDASGTVLCTTGTPGNTCVSFSGTPDHISISDGTCTINNIPLNQGTTTYMGGGACCLAVGANGGSGNPVSYGTVYTPGSICATPSFKLVVSTF